MQIHTDKTNPLHLISIAIICVHLIYHLTALTLSKDGKKDFSTPLSG
jgi:hypothetical protein